MQPSSSFKMGSLVCRTDPLTYQTSQGLFLGLYKNKRKALIFWDETSKTELLYPTALSSLTKPITDLKNPAFFERIQINWEKASRYDLPFLKFNGADEIKAKKKKVSSICLVHSCEIRNMLTKSEREGLSDFIKEFDQKPKMEIWDSTKNC